MESKGEINQYVCDTCGFTITTINADDGVTPFMMRCHNSSECKGTMKSKVYRVDQKLKPTHKWYRPDSLVRLTAWERDHVDKGGLILADIDQYVRRSQN